MNAETASVANSPAASAKHDNDREQGGHNPLRAPLRPKFHSGQVLTDADLTAVTDWVRTKQRCARLISGRGVVEGLEVRPDPKKADHVIVSAGYAVGPNGDDIVVPENTSYDLASAVAKAREAAPSTAKESTEGEVCFDITISYREKEVSPRVPVTRERSLVPSEVVFTRVEEGFRIDASPAELEGGDDQRREFLETTNIVPSFQKAIPYLKEMGEQVREWFLQQIKDQPLERFADLKRRIEKAKKETLSDEAEVSKLLFLLVQDRRLALLRRRDGTRDPQQAVGLARVRLMIPENAEESIEVINVDSGPPYRRRLERGRPTTKSAKTSLVSLGGSRADDVTRELQALGSTLVVLRELDHLPTNFRDLKTLLNWDPLARYGDGLEVTVFDFRKFGKEVGDLGCRVVSCVPVPLRLSIVTRPLKDEVLAGDSIEFETTVWNTTNRPIEIDLESKESKERGEPLARGIRLSPGQSDVRKEVVPIPRNFAGKYAYEVTVSGETPGTGPVQATDEATVRVLQPDPRLKVSKTVTPHPPGFTSGKVLYRIDVENLGDVGVIVSLEDNTLSVNEPNVEIRPKDRYRRDVPFEIVPKFGMEIENVLTVTGRTTDGRPVSGTATHVLTIPPESPWLWFVGFWKCLARKILWVERQHHKRRWFGGSGQKRGDDERLK